MDNDQVEGSTTEEILEALARLMERGDVEVCGRIAVDLRISREDARAQA